MLEGTLRVFLARCSSSLSGICMYLGGCAFRLQRGVPRELRGQMESPGMVQRLLSTRWSRNVPKGAVGDGRVRLVTLSSLYSACCWGKRRRKQKDRICHLEKCYFVVQPTLLVMVACLLNISTRVIDVTVQIMAKSSICRTAPIECVLLSRIEFYTTFFT